MLVDPEALNDVTGAIIGCAMEVHSHLGPGLIERLYEDAMIHELGERGLTVARQVPIAVPYKSITLSGQRLDLVVNASVVVELKSIEAVSQTHLAQLVSYLRAGGYPVGLLLNFNVARLKDGIFRRANTPLRRSPK